MPKHKFLSWSTIRKWVPLMEALGVSEAARSSRGFLAAYLNTSGRADRLTHDWISKREGFIARHMAQMIANDEPLFDEQGVPTRRHLALIAWAYSPQPRKL